MTSADANAKSEQMAAVAEIYRQTCEIGAALSNQDTYNLLRSTSEAMERQVYGKSIRGGWTEALSEARKGLTNLRLICAELTDNLSKDCD